MIPQDSADTSERFEAHIAPVRDGLVRLLDASDEQQHQWGSLPAVESLAMKELAAEHEYKGGEPWGNEPVAEAHNLGQLLLFTSNECARTATRLFTSEPTPVYAHMVLARAALEQAGRAWWLLDPTIGIRRRVARGINERLFGLYQQRDLPIDQTDKDRARDRYAALLAEGEQLGFSKMRKHPKTPFTFEEERPGQTAVVRSLLTQGDDANLGKLVYGYYSAVAHGTTFGLTQSVSHEIPPAPGMPGVTRRAIVTRSQDVVSLLTGLILGLGRAVQARNELFGWPSKSWATAYIEALRAAKSRYPPLED